MESVVITVSGYHGSERFNLIKLISRSGANYVGNMNSSITHLVCWKFEGKKYDLAKQYKAIIVNHRWIEDCVKKGKRVSERPYTDQCGEEVGPLRISTHIPQNPSKMCNNISEGSKEQLIALDSEDSDCERWLDATLLNENRDRVKRKTNSISYSRNNQLFSRKDSFEDFSLFDSKRLEAELNLPDSELLLKPKKRSSIAGESSKRGRRLVKGKENINTINITQNSEEILNHEINLTDSEVQIKPKKRSFGEPSRKGRKLVKGKEKKNILNFFTLNPEEKFDPPHIASTSHDESVVMAENGTIILDESEEIEDTNVLNQNDENIESEHIIKPSKQTQIEVSCAICYTDFSSTRGLLDCGHRFCFSCIESWSTHSSLAGKVSRCPLCNAKFEKITRVDDAITSDQKVYSQTIPIGTEVYVHCDERPAFSRNVSVAGSNCCHCLRPEPEELLERCNVCRIRCIHRFCLDPPLFPWTCNYCKDLQMLYRYNR